MARPGRSLLPSPSESPPGSETEEQGFPQLTRPRCDSRCGESGQDQALSSHPWGHATARAPGGPCQAPWGRVWALSLCLTHPSPPDGVPAARSVRALGSLPRWTLGLAAPPSTGRASRCLGAAKHPQGPRCRCPAPSPPAGAAGWAPVGLTPGVWGGSAGSRFPVLHPPGAGSPLQRPAAAPAASAGTGG